MKVKPKEIFVTLPHVVMFDDPEKIPEFASNINTILHGKVRLKYEELGVLSGQYVGIFYLQRNDEYQSIRDELMNMIILSEMGTTVSENVGDEEEESFEEVVTKPLDPDAKTCSDCGGFHSGVCPKSDDNYTDKGIFKDW